MSSPQQQFEQLLTSLLSGDNNTRNQAEKIYMNTKKQQPNQIIQALLQVARTSENTEMRNLAYVLIRRSLIVLSTEESFWSRLNPEIKQLLQTELLVALEKEEDKVIRREVGEVVITLAAEILEDEEQKGEKWDGLFECIFATAQSPNYHYRKSALQILSSLADYIKDQLTAETFEIIFNLLQAGLQDDSSFEVPLEALDSMNNFIVTFAKRPEVRAKLQSLIPVMLQVIAKMLNAEDEDCALKAIKFFISVAETDPGFFKPIANHVVDAMFKITTVAELEDSTRQIAMEFLITLAENKTNMCLRLEGFVQNIINILLQWMLDLPDTPLHEWNVLKDDQDDVVDVENSLIAEESLDRLCICFSGDVIVPIVMAHIPAFLQKNQTENDWKFRYVGLMCISMIGEGCNKVLMPYLHNLVSISTPFLKDPHPKVRYAAANTAGQMSTDFGPKLQKKYHQQYVEGLASLLDDSSNPKVQNHAAAAFINFSEKCTSKILAKYLPILMQKMTSLLTINNKILQEQAITAVGAFAGCAAAQFTPYYDGFVPFLREVLLKSTGPEQRMLRGKAMECISLIGVAVGKDKFMQDAKALMDVLSTINTDELDADDPHREFIMETWMRISSCLGTEFIPYLKYVVPPLIRIAENQDSLSITDASIVEGQAPEGWDILDVGDKRIQIHTSALEEKASAMNRLLCFALEMKDGYFEYVEATSKLCVPLMEFHLHSGVRIAAIAMVPHLLNSAKLFFAKSLFPNAEEGPRLLKELFTYLFVNLIETVKEETDVEVLIFGIEAIEKSLVAMGPNVLDVSSIKEILHLVCLIIAASNQRRVTLSAHNPDADADNSQTVKEEMNEEDAVLTELAEIMGALIINHPNLFIEVFGEISPLIGQMIQKDQPAALRQFALCVFDDLVEHTQERSLPFWEAFIPFMLDYATDPHPGVRQAACYGLGVCANHGGDAFRPICTKVFDILVAVITSPDSRTEENAGPTENSVSSIGKMLDFYPDIFGDKLEELFRVWISWLPLEFDEVEARACHKHLCSFITRNNPHVLGPNLSNLPQLLNIFATILDSPDTEEARLIDDKGLVVTILKQMNAQIPQLAQAAQGLEPEIQSVLAQALQ